MEWWFLVLFGIVVLFCGFAPLALTLWEKYHDDA